MSVNNDSEIGNSVGAKQVQSSALDQARGWADFLMDLEYRGRGDREKSARYRLSKKIGVPESYLHRLKYKAGEMRDVAGSVFLALQTAYNEACEINEAAADRYRDERLGRKHETANKKLAPSRLGVAAAEDRPEA